LQIKVNLHKKQLMRKSFYLISVTLCLLILKAEAQNYNQTDNGIKAEINNIDVAIQFYSQNIVRILKSPKGISCEKESLSVIKQPEKINFVISIVDDQVRLASKAIEVQLNTKTGRVTYFVAGDKTPLFTEKDYGIQFTPVKDVEDDTYIVRQAFMLDQDEAIYGLGQFEHGKMVQRMQKLYMRQNINVTVIPFFQSIKGYGVFWDNYSPTTFVDNLQETSFESEVGDCADYYFMYGGNADGVIAQMRDLTGQVPMFPYWTFGYWQSRERYKSQDETVGVVKKYRELGVPFDGIIQDWQYWSEDNAYWNAMEFGNPGFPDPRAMIDEVHKLNAHIMISVWASFGPKTKQYADLEEKNMLLDFTTWPLNSGVRVYDPFNPEARDIYWKYLNKGIFSLGMDGWWLDSTEPDHFDIKEEDFDNKTYLGSFRRVRNAYPLMTVGGVYNHQREVTSGKRVFILTRSAFAGQQRYGANSWSGDVHSSWKVLRNQVSAGTNFSLCGIPYWNSDIGGFFPHVNYPQGVDDITYHELYVRWLQFGAFCPMMRSHGTHTPREIYQFGKKGDRAYDAIEEFINLRYRLIPYIYSTSWDVTANSSSMMRALMMDFAADKDALDINDQYMFGKSFLVCPVTEPLYTSKNSEGSTEYFSITKTTTSYLPAGTLWYDFWTGEKLNGGQKVEKPTPIDIMPLYVKAGSIVPMGPLVQYANEKIDPIEIRIYPGADGEFVLYDDERDNYNYEKGLYATVNFTWNDEEQTLTIGERKGSFPGMAGQRKFDIVFVELNQGCGMKPSEKVNKTIIYTGKQKVIKLD
jgi:alpha-D-xyloside xylohydrolase